MNFLYLISHGPRWPSLRWGMWVQCYIHEQHIFNLVLLKGCKIKISKLLSCTKYQINKIFYKYICVCFVSSPKWQIYSYHDFLSSTKSELLNYSVAQNTCVMAPNQKEKGREREQERAKHGAIDIAGDGLYRRLWAVRARSNQQHALIGSWAMPPTTCDIQIELGGEPIWYHPPWHI